MKTAVMISLLAVIIVAGCTASTTGTIQSNSTLSGGVDSMDMSSIVEKGDRVFVDYTGTLDNGTVFDTSIGRDPMDFDAGAGQMIKGFDSAVIGMKIGEDKTIRLEPADAYGDYNPKNIVEVPLAFVPNGTKVNDTLYAQGQQVRVASMDNVSAFIDINHPLAGKALTFNITIVSITKRA